LPWDATTTTLPGGARGSRLIPHGELPGQGTPGKHDPHHGTRTRPPAAGEPPLAEGETYWWRERKWTAAGHPPPLHVPEWRPPDFAQRMTPRPTTQPELHTRLADLMQQHGGNLSAVARALGVPRTTLQSYFLSVGLQ